MIYGISSLQIQDKTKTTWIYRIFSFKGNNSFFGFILLIMLILSKKILFFDRITYGNCLTMCGPTIFTILRGISFQHDSNISLFLPLFTAYSVLAILSG